MSRFYKTSASTYVDDKMFQLPADLMYKTIVKKDEAITGVLDEANTVRDNIKTQNIKSDDPTVNAALKKYEEQINSYTDAIYSKPLDFKRQQGNLMRVSRELDADLQYGMLSKAQSQFDAQKTYNENIDKRKDIDASKKQMAKRISEMDYERTGGLNYQEDGSYNSFDDHSVAVLADVDTNEIMNKLGTNFHPDKTSNAWKNKAESGYFRSGSQAREELKESDVAIVMNSALNEAGWEEEQRQLLEMEIRTGKKPADTNVDNIVSAKRQELINAAKTKFGYVSEATASGISVDSADIAREKMANADADKAASGGEILVESRNVKESKYGDSAVNMDGYGQKVNAYMLKGMDVENLDELVNMVYKTTGPEKKKNLKQFRAQLEKAGLTELKFVNYVNYINSDESLETPHKDGYDSNSRKDVIEQKSNLKTLVSGINNMSANEEVKGLRILHSNGEYEELDAESLGDLIANGDEENYYAPVTGYTEVLVPLTDSEGNLIDKDGFPLQSKKGKKITKYKRKEDLPSNLSSRYATKKVKEPYYDTEKSPFKATTGNVKQNNVYQINLSGANIDEKEIVVSQHWMKTNRKTGKKEVFTLDVKLYPNHIQIK